MKRIVAAIGYALLACALHAEGAASPAIPTFKCDRSPLLLRNVDVWTSGGSEPHDVLVVGGYISKVSAPGRLQAPGDAREIDGKGKILLPGLIDAHVHFVFPGPVGDRKGDPVADALSFGRQLLASGVTSARVHLDTLEHARL